MLTAADTAFSIAVVRADESAFPERARLFEDPYAAIFAAAGAHAAEGTRRYLDLPFFRDGIRLRTRFIDDFTREALAAGLDQVVILGVGFDCRSLRMPELRTARVLEVDFETQLETKRSLLAAHGLTLPDRVASIACDFNAVDFERTLQSSLEAASFDPDRGALFIWEGVTAYIDHASIDRSLAFMARIGGAKARLVFDFGDPFSEPELWQRRVESAGFARFERAGLDAVWRRYLPGEPHPNAWVSNVGTAFGSRA